MRYCCVKEKVIYTIGIKMQKEFKMGTKIYVLVAYAKYGRIVDLGYSDSLETTKNEIRAI
jgi:hypothetical protein